jgi:ribosome-associated protein
LNSNDIARLMMKKLKERQGEDLLAYDISTASLGADVLVIATGRNTRHASALADELAELGRDSGLTLASREGRASGGWILLDFESIIVNVLDPQNRDYYALERLWKEYPLLDESSQY